MPCQAALWTAACRLHHTSWWLSPPDASSGRQDALLIPMPYLASPSAALVSTLQLATGVCTDSGVHRSRMLGEGASGSSGAAMWPDGPAAAASGAVDQINILHILGLTIKKKKYWNKSLCLPLLSAAAFHLPRLPGLLRPRLPLPAAALGIPDMQLWASVPPLLLLLPSLPRGRGAGAALLGTGKSQGAACRRPYPSLLRAVPALATLENSCSREERCPQESEGGHILCPTCSQFSDASSCSRAKDGPHNPAMPSHLHCPVLSQCTSSLNEAMGPSQVPAYRLNRPLPLAWRQRSSLGSLACHDLSPLGLLGQRCAVEGLNHPWLVPLHCADLHATPLWPIGRLLQPLLVLDYVLQGKGQPCSARPDMQNGPGSCYSHSGCSRPPRVVHLPAQKGNKCPQSGQKVARLDAGSLP